MHCLERPSLILPTTASTLKHNISAQTAFDMQIHEHINILQPYFVLKLIDVLYCQITSIIHITHNKGFHEDVYQGSQGLSVEPFCNKPEHLCNPFY